MAELPLVIEKPLLVALNNRTLSMGDAAIQLGMSVDELRSSLNANGISLWYAPSGVIRSAGIPGAHVNIQVTCRGEHKYFLVQDTQTLTQFLELMEDHYNRPPAQPLARGEYRLYYMNGGNRFYIESHKDYSSCMTLYREHNAPLLGGHSMRLWVTVGGGPRVARLLNLPVEEQGFQPTPNNN